SVSRTRREVRSNSSAPSSRSSRRIRWLSGGWAIPSRSAARPKCSSSATTRKHSSARNRSTQERYRRRYRSGPSRVLDAEATRVILIDPWLTRFHTGTYTSAGADPNTPLRVDTGLIDGYGLRADQILVTHGHYDHLTDVPHLAATTGATVFGTESHANLLRAL